MNDDLLKFGRRIRLELVGGGHLVVQRKNVAMAAARIP